MQTNTDIKIDIKITPLCEVDISNEPCYATYTLNKEKYQQIVERIDNFSKSKQDKPLGPESVGVSEIVTEEEFDKCINDALKNFARRLLNFEIPFDLWSVGEGYDTEDWFEKELISHIDYRYPDICQIDPDDLLTEMSPYIYPDEKDYDDPEEYAEAVENLEIYSERDQHDLITVEGAKAKIKKLLRFKNHVMKSIQDFYDNPAGEADYEQFTNDLLYGVCMNQLLESNIQDANISEEALNFAKEMNILTLRDLTNATNLHRRRMNMHVRSEFEYLLESLNLKWSKSFYGQGD